MLKRVLRFLADLLWPPRCVWCDRVKGFGRCEACEKEVAGWHRADAALGVPQLPTVGRVLAPYAYSGRVREAVLRFKAPGHDYMAEGLGWPLVECLLREELPEDMLVVAVPKAKGEGGGYNTPDLLARALAKQLGYTGAAGALEKIRSTPPQASLDGQARRKNLKGAFRADGGLVRSKHVLLVDDVVTTGSTLEECGAALKKAGAERVDAVCIAVALLGQDKEKQHGKR